MTIAESQSVTEQEALAAIIRRVDSADLAARMVSAFRGDIAGYQRLPEPVIVGQISEISRRNVELFFRSVLERRSPTDADMEPVRESAKDRATEGMPLEDLLHAYRLGGRMGWEALAEAALPEERFALLHGARLLMDFVDLISSAVAQAYLEESQHLVSEQERQLRNLLDALVSGGSLTVELRGLAERIGIEVSERYRPFAAAVHGAAARRHSELAAVLRAQGVLALTEGDRVAGLAPDTEAPLGIPTDGAAIAIAPATERATLATALEDMRLLADLGRRLGVSGALDRDKLLPELLLASAPRAAEQLSQRVLSPLESYRPRRGADLVETLAVYVHSRLDRRRAAERLHVHPNTLDYRLRQIRELTGLDVHRPDNLALAVLALRQRELAG